MRDVWLTIAGAAFMTYLAATILQLTQMGFSASKERSSAMEEVKCATPEKLQEDMGTLTDDDLRLQLRQFGELVGPITATTRRILEKKLAGYLNVDCTDSEKGQGDYIQNTKDIAENSENVENHKNGAEKLDQEEMTTECSTYFGVAVPTEITSPDAAEERVFTDKATVLQYTKKIVGARFKIFPTYDEALNFAQSPCDIIKEVKKDDTGESGPFRGPRIQDLVKLRKGIETGNQLLVREIVWSNPRYLISSGDTPTILQEGFRYNAFHTAASKNRAPMCRYLLSTLGDPRFLKLLYPQDSDEMRDERMEHILDLYLNMPDKMLGETPLHFACKFGHHEVVKVLASHPLTDRVRKNKDGRTPEEVICSRVNKAPQELKDQIKELLEAQYYVPLLRGVDNTVPAIVADPWSPESGAPVPSQIGILTTETPEEPALVVKAFAGPMSPTQAKSFRKKWLTPPSPKPADVQSYNKVRLGDSDKGLERLGRNLAKELNIPWQEYWDFLGGFTDLRGDDGLDQLEHYLAEKYESSLSQNHLDCEIERLEAKLRAFHVTSPESPGVLDAIYQEHFTQTPVTQSTTPLGASPLFKSNPTRHVPSDDEKEDFIKHFDFGDAVLDPGNNNQAKSARVVVDSNEINVIPQPHVEGNLLSAESGDSLATKNSQEEEDTFMESSEEEWKPRRCHNNSVCSVGSDCDSYYTAAESVGAASVKDEDETEEDLDETACSSADYSVFIFGEEPTKFDVDVFNALDGLSVSPQHYPNVYKWRNKIKSHSDEDRSKWKTPTPRRTASVTRGGSLPPSPLASPRFHRVKMNLNATFNDFS